MAKRLTDSDKWRDEWFSELEALDKLLWIYMLDNCDHAGYYKHARKLCNLLTGCDYSLDDIIEVFGGRVIKVKDRALIIPKFLMYQYPNGLNSKKPVILSVVKLLEKHDCIAIIRESLGNGYLMVSESLPNHCPTIKSKSKSKDKGKNKSKDNIKKEKSKSKIRLLPEKNEMAEKLREEAQGFASWFKATLPPTRNISKTDSDNFAELYLTLRTKKGKDKNEIFNVCNWARKDNMWSTNFLSPLKLLRKNPEKVLYYDVFLTKMENEKKYGNANKRNNPNKQHARPGVHEYDTAKQTTFQT